ncbi:MAG: hypothetical protein ACYDAG_18210 [Chloroflexota bacterium]
MRRRAARREAGGYVFYFVYDRSQPDALHIWARGESTTEEAIDIFFSAQANWNERRKRFETMAGDRGIYWVELPDEEKAVLIISAFETQEERNG